MPPKKKPAAAKAKAGAAKKAADKKAPAMKQAAMKSAVAKGKEEKSSKAGRAAASSSSSSKPVMKSVAAKGKSKPAVKGAAATNSAKSSKAKAKKEATPLENDDEEEEEDEDEEEDAEEDEDEDDEAEDEEAAEEDEEEAAEEDEDEEEAAQEESEEAAEEEAAEEEAVEEDEEAASSAAMDVDSPVEEDAAEEETGKKAKNGGGKMKSKKKVESSGSDDDEPIVPASKKRKENAPSPDEKKDRPQYRLRDFEVDDMSVVYGEDGLDEFDGHYGLVEDVVAGAEKAAVRAGHEEEFNPELKRLREEHENMRAGLVENEEVRKALQEKAERRLPQRDADKKEDDDEDHGHEDLNQAYTYIFVGDVSKQVYKYDQVNRYWRIRTDQAPLTIHDTEGENTRVIHGMTREEYLEDLYQKREDRRQQAAFEKRQAQRERQERQREKRDSTMLTGAERAERKARKKREREQRPGAQQFLESESELEEDAEMQLEEGRAELEAVNPDPALRELRKLAEVSRKIAESDQGDPDIIAFTDKYGFGYRMWRWKLIHPTTSAKTEEAQRKPPKKIELSKEDAVTKEAREKLGFHYRPKGDDKHVPDKYLIEFRRIDEETGYWRPEDGEEEDWKIVYREKVDETTEEVRQGTAARKVSDSLAQADEKLVTRLRLEAADAAGSGNRQDRQLVQRKQHKLFFKQWKDLIAGKTRPNHEHSERPEAYWFFLRHGSMSRRDLYAPPHNFETGFQGRSGIRFVAHDRFREQQNKVFLGRLLQQRTLPISNSMKPLAYKNEQADAATAAKQKGSAKVPAEATYAGVEADQYDAGADANLLDGGDRSAVPYAMGPDYDQGELYDENAPWDAHEADAFGNISAAPNQDDYNYGAY